MMTNRMLGAGLVLLLAGCHAELGRISTTGVDPATGTARVALKPGTPLRFYADLEVTYSGTPLATWRIKVTAGGATQEVACDPFDVIEPARYFNRNGERDRYVRYVGRMRCEARVDAPEADVEATLVIVQRPAVFEPRRMDLLIMQ